MADDPIFFVVRPGMKGNIYSLEHGDFSNRYAKDELITYRTRLPTGSELSLSDCIRLYEAGVRVKKQ